MGFFEPRTGVVQRVREYLKTAPPTFHVKQVIDDIKVSDETMVLRTLNKLADEGFLRKEQKEKSFGNMRHKYNVYHLVPGVDLVKKLDGDKPAIIPPPPLNEKAAVKLEPPVANNSELKIDPPLAKAPPIPSRKKVAEPGKSGYVSTHAQVEAYILKRLKSSPQGRFVFSSTSIANNAGLKLSPVSCALGAFFKSGRVRRVSISGLRYNYETDWTMFDPDGARQEAFKALMAQLDDRPAITLPKPVASKPVAPPPAPVVAPPAPALGPKQDAVKEFVDKVLFYGVETEKQGFKREILLELLEVVTTAMRKV